jgi:Protein of unknown function (DUF3311)
LRRFAAAAPPPIDPKSCRSAAGCDKRVVVCWLFSLPLGGTHAIVAPRASNGSRGTGNEGRQTMDQQTEKRSCWSWWYLLLLVQFVFLLWVPSYNKLEPTLIGMPFFYWYQLLWVAISAILTAIVYFATTE